MAACGFSAASAVLRAVFNDVVMEPREKVTPQLHFSARKTIVLPN